MTAPDVPPLPPTVYYWRDGLVLLARSLRMDRPTRPLVATLRLALAEPYTLYVEGRRLRTHASLLAPKATRQAIHADNSDFAVFFLPMARPEHIALRRVLGPEAVLDIPLERFAPVLPRLRDALAGRLPKRAIVTLTNEVMALATGDKAATLPATDPRVTAVCETLDRTPLNQVSLPRLARQVNLSPSRLRGLFKQQIGSTIGEYARWTALWQGLEAWTTGMTFGEVSRAAGFFDLAHSNRIFIENFGINPSLATDHRLLRLERCD